MKVRQKFDPPPVREATQFIWPDDKPVRKGDTFLGMPVRLDEAGAFVALTCRYDARMGKDIVRHTDWVIADVPSRLLNEQSYEVFPDQSLFGEHGAFDVVE